MPKPREKLRRAVEALEPRFLFSLSAVGTEFRVNTTIPPNQSGPTIAADADGDFVVAWHSNTQEGADGSGVYAQRFNSAGVAQGGEIHVNTYTPGPQFAPTVAMDADGDFVIAWQSDGQDGDGSGIYAQRYNAVGTPQGTEFLVNSTITGSQAAPSAAMDSTGNFVITWHSINQDGAGTQDVFARRYNLDGAAQGTEFYVNTTFNDKQNNPSVAMDRDGDFVITWQSFNQDGSGYGIYSQRFNAVGAPQGGELPANTVTISNQAQPAVAMDPAGDFVVTWQSGYDQDGQYYGTYARRYNAAGAAQGGEILVNTYIANSQRNPAVAMGAGGDFTVTWQSALQDASSYGVYAQRFNAAGVKIARPTGSVAGSGNEFLVNTTTASSQAFAAIALDARGDLMIAWTGSGVGDVGGIFAQRYTESVDTAPPSVTVTYINGMRAASYATFRGPVSQVVFGFTENLSTVGGTSGANSVTNPANWLITRDGANVTPVTISFALNGATNRYEATVNLPAAYTTGNFSIAAKDTIQDAAGNALDGDNNGIAGAAYPFSFSVVDRLVPGNEFVISPGVFKSQTPTSILMDDAGKALIGWTSTGGIGGGNSSNAQRYLPDGTPSGNLVPFAVPSNSAMDSAGNYAYAYILSSGSFPFFFPYGVGFTRYNTSDQATISGTAHQVTGSFTSVDMGMDGAGNFMITWGGLDEITARRFNSAGSPLGNEFHVNTTTTGNQTLPKIAVNEAGDSVIVWQSTQAGSLGLYAQRYNASGVAQGSEFRINDAADADVFSQQVEMDAAGNFVVTWVSNDVDIYARRFDRFGTALAGEFRVNAYIAGSQTSPSLATDDAGDFIIAWQSQNQDGSGLGVFANSFKANGTASGEFFVNAYTSMDQGAPLVAMNDAGDVAYIVWGSVGQLGGFSSVVARRFGFVVRLPPLAR